MSMPSTQKALEHQVSIQALAAKELNHSLPLNDYNLPTGFYRIDYLPTALKFSGQTKQGQGHNSQEHNSQGQRSARNSTDSMSAALLVQEMQCEPEQPPIDYESIPELELQELLYKLTPRLVVTGSGKHKVYTHDYGCNLTEVQAWRENYIWTRATRRRQELQQSVIDDAPSFKFERRELQNAWVPLNYLEGFPTLPNGQPFWSKLEYETGEAHLAFEAYLQLPTINKQGIRQLTQLPDFLQQMSLMSNGNGNGNSNSGDQQLMIASPSLLQLQQYYHIYYWQHRIRAYDLFKVASWRRQQEERAIATMDDHYIMAQGMMEKLSLYMSNEEDFWQVLTPKAAIDLLKVLVGIQRLSVGLPAASPAVEGRGSQSGGLLGGGQVSSLEMILRTVAQQQGSDTRLQLAEQGQQQVMDKALSSPELTRIAQELILSFNKG